MFTAQWGKFSFGLACPHIKYFFEPLSHTILIISCPIWQWTFDLLKLLFDCWPDVPGWWLQLYLSGGGIILSTGILGILQLFVSKTAFVCYGSFWHGRCYFLEWPVLLGSCHPNDCLLYLFLLYSALWRGWCTIQVQHLTDDRLFCS